LSDVICAEDARDKNGNGRRAQQKEKARCCRPLPIGGAASGTHDDRQG
jgi:hypothetical protein